MEGFAELVDEIGPRLEVRNGYRHPADRGHPSLSPPSAGCTYATTSLMEQRGVERLFATVRLRRKVSEDPGCCAAGVAMAYKLIEGAQPRRRAVTRQLVALARNGAVFGHVNSRTTHRHHAGRTRLITRDRGRLKPPQGS
jgi:hypothetical protein